MSRIALVTGGTRGIGEAISAALKTAGRTVIASYNGNQMGTSIYLVDLGVMAR